jgi:galactose mutarotase-like enzyme
MCNSCWIAGFTTLSLAAGVALPWIGLLMMPLSEEHLFPLSLIFHSIFCLNKVTKSTPAYWVLVADKENAGQPACPGKWKKCRKKKRRQNMNSNTNVMYIRVFSVSCNIVVMFSCTLVRSHPDSRRRWGET